MAEGIWLLLHPHTVQLSGAVCVVVAKVSQIMLTNIPDWVSCGFAVWSTRSGALLLWPESFKMILPDARSMWKIFVPIKKGQLVLMALSAAGATGSVSLSLCVCERVSVFGLGQSDTLVSQQDGSDRGHRAVSRQIHQSHRPRVFSIPECNAAAAKPTVAAMMGSRWTAQSTDSTFG